MNADLLIYHYKNGSISPKDEQKLLQWIKTSAQNRDYFKKYISVINSLERNNKRFNESASTAFADFLNITSKETITKSISFYPLLKIAAVIVLFLGLGYLLSETVFHPINDVIVYNATSMKDQMLPDETKVTVNKGSSLTYPEKFKGEVRTVSLKGQAFFDVARNEEKPFVINVGTVVIEVLGTSFDVSEDDAKQMITVTVETGKVKVTCSELGFEKILEPHQQCSIHLGNNAAIDETVVQNNNHLSWLTGVLDFEETPLEDVIVELNKLYDKDLVIGSDLIKNCKLTTKINNYPLPDVIKMLEQTLDLQIIENDEAFVIIGEGCYN